MNVGRAMEFMQAVIDADNRFNIQKRLQKLDGRLQEVVNAPGGGQQQTDAMNALIDLRKHLAALMDELTPAQWEFLRERGLAPLFGPELGNEIERRFSSSGVTPAVVKNYVSEVVGKRNKVLELFKAGLTSLTGLGFKAEALQPGEAELGFTIPRELFENSLGGLAGEFETIDRVMSIFSEAVTGNREIARVGDISCSDPLLLIPTTVAVAVAVGKTVTWLLQTYEQTLKIRKLKAESKEVGIGDGVLKEYQALIEKTIDEAIEKRIAELLPPKERKPRQQELSNGLAWAMRAILARVERGMTVEVRFLPPAVAEEAAAGEQAAADPLYQELAAVQQALLFPVEVEGEPILKRPPAVPPAEPAKAAKAKGPPKPKKPKKKNGNDIEAVVALPVEDGDARKANGGEVAQ
jgi:hypothetical protein